MFSDFDKLPGDGAGDPDRTGSSQTRKHAGRLPLLAWGALALAVGYLAWTVFIGDQSPPPRSPGPQRAAAPAAPAGPVKILHFYGMPGEVARGERVSICYGVANARSVRLEPPLEPIQPHWNRCLVATPTQTTTYTLTAEGQDGRQTSVSFTIQVRESPPKILFVELSSRQLRQGEPLTLCYGVQHAASVRLEPLGLNLKPAERDCVRVYPPRTLTFTLIAGSADGRTDRERFTVEVR